MVDGSVMPQVITGNINIPIVMMAERAADFIKQEQFYAGHSLLDRSHQEQVVV